MICADESIPSEGSGKMNLLHWRSGKMHRIMNSTLAAESQSLSKGLSELAWTITVYKDMVTEGFDLREWQQSLRDQRVVTLTKDDMDETLKRSLCVVDAKSLFDHLVKETVGCTDDKRIFHSLGTTPKDVYGLLNKTSRKPCPAFTAFGHR